MIKNTENPVQKPNKNFVFSFLSKICQVCKKYEKWLNRLSQLLGAGVGAIAMAAILGAALTYHYSKKIADLKNSDEIKIHIIENKIKTYNNIDSHLYKLKIATIRIIYSMNRSHKKSYSSSKCKFLRQHYKIDSLNDSLHVAGHDINYYFGPTALNTGIKMTNWYNDNIKTCFHRIQDAENKISSKFEAFQVSLQRNLNNGKTFSRK